MKRFLLCVGVLLGIGTYAQSEAPAIKTESAVGIETTQPRATLDVNGDARLRTVEKMTTTTSAEEIFADCPCVLTLDKYGVIKRIPKEKFVLIDDSTNSGTPPATTTYSSSKSYTATGVYKNQNCGSGKVAEDYTVSHTETVTLTSEVSQDDADKKALAKATQIANQWVADHGQAEANAHGKCATTQPTVYTATAGPKKQKRLVQKENCGYGQVGAFVEVESPEFTGHGESNQSQTQAQRIADVDLEYNFKKWYIYDGQAKANETGTCLSAPNPSSMRVCETPSGRFLGNVIRTGVWRGVEGTLAAGGWARVTDGSTTLECNEAMSGRYVRGVLYGTYQCMNGRKGYLWAPSDRYMPDLDPENYANYGHMCAQGY